MRVRRFRYGGAFLAVLVIFAIVFFAVRALVGGDGSRSPQLGASVGRVMREVREDRLAGGHVVELQTRRCPTEMTAGGFVRVPSRVPAREPAGVDPRLLAYASGSGQLMPAPAGWECTAGMGADGNQEIAAGPPGSVTVRGEGDIPELRGGGPSVQVTLTPACAGCIAEAICSFFPESSVVKPYESLQPCDGEADGEVRRRISASTFLIADPPGVRGAAAGSGGRLPAIGMLTFAPAIGLRQVGCALPPAEFTRCAAVLVAFVELEPDR
jgi:hypothetical protein